MVEQGHVVREMKIGNTHIRICDDYCRDKTKEDVDEILRRIARNAIGPITAAALAAEEAEEKARKKYEKAGGETVTTQYGIYQVNRDRDVKGVCFCGSEILKLLNGKFAVDPSVYDKVFDGECSAIYSLNGIWLNHNIRTTTDKKYDPSLSVSDVVEIRESEGIEPGFYFVDSVGFKKIDFDKTKCGKGES